MLHSVSSYAANRIALAPLRERPFPHLLVEDFLPHQIYAEMLALFPSEALARLRETTGAADEPNMIAEANIHLLTERQREFWTGLRSVYAAAQTEAMRRFSSQIDAKLNALDALGLLKPEAPRNSAELKADCDSGCQLLGRSASFAIGAHIHHPAEVINLLHYLPADRGQKKHGTRLFSVARRTDLNLIRGYPNYKERDVREVSVVPYLPNTAVIWVNDFRSIHAAKRADGTERRYVFAFTSMKIKAIDTEAINSGNIVVPVEPSPRRFFFR